MYTVSARDTVAHAHTPRTPSRGIAGGTDVTHVYRASGHYSVMATVTDAQGTTATSSITVPVSPASCASTTAPAGPWFPGGFVGLGLVGVAIALAAVALLVVYRQRLRRGDRSRTTRGSRRS